MVKILLVDNDEFVIEYLKAHLMDWGYEVLSAQDGADAVSLASSTIPDLIIMDINMPVMTGYETIKKIKSEDNTARVPIIALTANNTAEDRDHAYEVGCQAYIAKPIVDIDVVREVVTRILS